MVHHAPPIYAAAVFGKAIRVLTESTVIEFWQLGFATVLNLALVLSARDQFQWRLDVGAFCNGLFYAAMRRYSGEAISSFHVSQFGASIANFVNGSAWYTIFHHNESLAVRFAGQDGWPASPMHLTASRPWRT